MVFPDCNYQQVIALPICCVMENKTFIAKHALSLCARVKHHFSNKMGFTRASLVTVIVTRYVVTSYSHYVSFVLFSITHPPISIELFLIIHFEKFAAVGHGLA